MGYEAKIILDSITTQGHRLTTIQATFPRFILAEVNTHRMFSRNSASSRAIPVSRRIEQIEADPFVPLAFGKNKAGMQAGEELDAEDAHMAHQEWLLASKDAVFRARQLSARGVHKQWANRVIETYAWHTAVISATEWDNHDALRIHPAASPEYQTIASLMKQARVESRPNLLHEGDWHLPYVHNRNGSTPEDDLIAACALDKATGVQWLEILRKVSVGRCAAVSYERQDTKNFKKDIERYELLRSSGHMSPFEHAARPMTLLEYNELFCQKAWKWNEQVCEWEHGHSVHYCGNFQGWIQDRKMIRNEHDFSKIKETV